MFQVLIKKNEPTFQLRKINKEIVINASGKRGPQGEAGVGVPAGGTIGQFLAKLSNLDYDTQWIDAAGLGDMVKAIYDPNNVNDDAFDMENMVEGATKKIFTSAERTKLSGIAAGAEVNVNADWDAVSGDALILNKPTSLSDFTNDLGFITDLSSFDTGDLAEGSNLYFTNERVDDRVAALLVAGAGININYNDPANTLTILSTITQYTDELAQDAVGGILVDSAEIDFTYNDTTPSITASIVTGSIDETKLDASVNASLDLADSAVQDLADLGITASASELNVLDGITASTTELNYTDGVTSPIQTQLDNKQPLDAFLTDIADLTDPGADRLLFWDDSAGGIDWLSFGANLTIDGTTIDFSDDIEAQTLTLTELLDMISTDAGGDNDFDSTSRIVTRSYQQAIQPNYFAETIRMDIMTDEAKNIMAWRDAYTDPDNPRSVAWIVAHYKRNGIGGPPIHSHWSIETTKADLETLVTRLEFPYDGDVILAQFHNSNMQVNSGFARLVNAAENNRPLLWGTTTTDVDGNQTYTNRWGINVDDQAETGSSATGSDWNLDAYADNGDFISHVMQVLRTSRKIGFNAPAKSDIVARFSIHTSLDENVLHLKNTHSGATNAAILLLEGDNTADRLIQGGLASDTTKRFTTFADGKLEWGPGGASARDTNLYRSAADTLKTDDALEVVDDAYAAGWNGSLKVPTKNAVYDKIESLSGVYQPLDSDLTTIAGLTATTDNFIVSVSSAWASRTPAQVRTTLALVIGTNVQAWDADLDAIAALSPTNDDIIQRKAGAWANRTMAQLKTDLVLVKGDVGLGNVDNTSDATKNSATATLTNKRVSPRVSSTASGSSVTPDKASFDRYVFTALAANLTINNPTLDVGEVMVIQILDNATPRTLSWGGQYVGIDGQALASVTIASKQMEFIITGLTATKYLVTYVTEA